MYVGSSIRIQRFNKHDRSPVTLTVTQAELHRHFKEALLKACLN